METKTTADFKNVDDNTFELDSDLSDTDAQDLLNEFKALDPNAVGRDLANATLALQEHTWQKWSE